MNSLLILISLFACLSALEKDQASLATLKVKVTHIANSRGHVYLSLYDSEEHFLKKNYRSFKVPAKEGALEFVFENLPMQTYALMAFHDENDNGDVDTYFFGLPKEAYGFSNDARSAFGPPTFKYSKFDLDKAEYSIQFKLQ